MVLYAAIYIFCMMNAFAISSSNITADGFYMAVCLHINVMQQHLHTLIGEVNNLFRKYFRILHWLELNNRQ